MFEHWHEFYLLIGGAAAALIGLVFVVVTLNSGVDRPTALRGAALYMTPLVFSLGIVVALSGVAMAPDLSPQTVGLLIGAVALWGIGHCIFVGYGMKSGRTPAAPHWSDFWAYSVAPGVLHAALLAVGVSCWADPEAAAYGLATVLMLLLLVTIRNAWDLVTWIAPRHEPTEP